MNDGPDPQRKRKRYSTQDVRQGDIVLRKRWERWVFVGGLVAAIILALVARAMGLF
jgi:hypothetical protein